MKFAGFEKIERNLETKMETFSKKGMSL